MPVVEVVGYGRVEAEPGERLVLAIERSGVDIGHRCGGKARCTTCRVRVLAGEPKSMTRAERDKLAEKELLGEVRLSCQIQVESAMRVEPLMTLQSMGWSDTGPAPAPEIEPEPEWIPVAETSK